MAFNHYSAVEDWFLSSIAEGTPKAVRFSGGENLSDFAHKLMAYSKLLDHLLVRARPRFVDGGAYRQDRLDPRVICLAVENMDIRWGSHFEVEHDPRYPIDIDSERWNIAGDHRYDNVLNARKLLKQLVDEKAHIVSEHTGTMPQGRAISKDAVLGFLYHTEFGMGNLHFADHQEAYQEMAELERRGGSSRLHRIEEREEVIARDVWQLLKQGAQRVYLVLGYQHFLSPDKNPVDTLKGERDRYLLFDFMEEERIPHVVVAPHTPRLIRCVSIPSPMTVLGWETAKIGCHLYNKDFAAYERSKEHLQELVDSRPDLTEKLLALKGRTKDRDQKAKGDIHAEDEAMGQNYGDTGAVWGEIKAEPELQRQLEEFTVNQKKAWEDQLTRIKK